ncbi:hypothetical protein RFI_32071 [Reticulomyxa filosa]|uniref:NACHT domain-containing protein n=1 Tax=Reticulomyxa filosa TaxID=46433 RepID=X6LX69_RETFI|nr:hypothetical protein RFI_32071 [Reticulomyxa filosa]|eukprot:ETO05325.1 hypothetical protein RFI_32071 [Reticulomyxa filosa]
MTKATDATKQKLKDYYKSQDELIPLFDDHQQSIANCYIRLVLLTQQQFQKRKDKITNKSNEESEKWPNTLDYSLFYGGEQETTELEDIWGIKTETGRLKIRYISIHGEAGTGKSVLTQRIAWLWIKKQMWRDHFQLLLHIPLRKIANIFDNTLDEKDNVIEMQWSKIMGELNIPRWNTNDTKYIVHAKDGLLLVLDGFDEIANELNSKPVVPIQYVRTWMLDRIETWTSYHSLRNARKTLEWINKKYLRKCIAIPSQWSRIHSFGFLQGQESMSPSHPTNPVYFPHLTFQE